MKYLSIVPALFCAGLASQAAAQDGFYTNGYAELSYYSAFGGDSNTLGYADATIGYTDAASGFGGEFGVEAVTTEGDSYSALYGVLTYQSSFGKLSFGVPRAALDAYLTSVPSVAGLQIFNIAEYGSTKRSLLSSAYLLSDDDTPVGLRYDGSFGNTNVGASYHSYEEADIYNLAANTQLGQTTLTGALEHVTSPGESDTRYFLGAEAKFGQVTAGLLYSGNFAFSNDAAVEAYAKYKPLDQLELTATALNIDFGAGSNTLYGLAADYNFSQGVYVKAGVADDFQDTSDASYNLAVGLRF